MLHYVGCSATYWSFFHGTSLSSGIRTPCLPMTSDCIYIYICVCVSVSSLQYMLDEEPPHLFPCCLEQCRNHSVNSTNSRNHCNTQKVTLVIRFPIEREPRPVFHLQTMKKNNGSFTFFVLFRPCSPLHPVIWDFNPRKTLSVNWGLDSTVICAELEVDKGDSKVN
jgi:hypothetical protein